MTKELIPSQYCRLDSKCLHNLRHFDTNVATTKNHDALREFFKGENVVGVYTKFCTFKWCLSWVASRCDKNVLTNKLHTLARLNLIWTNEAGGSGEVCYVGFGHIRLINSI